MNLESSQSLESNTTHFTINRSSQVASTPFTDETSIPLDTLDQMINQSMGIAANKTEYLAQLGIPQLIIPNPEEQSELQPYSVNQKLIKKFYTTEVMRLLGNKKISSEEAMTICNALLTNTSLTDPVLAQLAKEVDAQATVLTRKEGRLSGQWTIHSQSSDDWVSTPVIPYSEEEKMEILQYYEKILQAAFLEYKKHKNELNPPLTDQQIHELEIALQTGKPPENLKDTYNTIIGYAQEATQKTYGLPSTWVKGTSNIEDWKPINFGIVTPQKIAQNQVENFITHISELSIDFERASQKIMDRLLPPDDPNREAVKEFIRFIIHALGELKSTLRETQMRDAESSRDFSQVKLEEIQQKQADLKKIQETDRQIYDKQKSLNKFREVMKILGPTLSALVTVISIAVIIVTTGPASPLFITAIIVGAVATTYSIVDSQLGVTGKIVESFNKSLESTMNDAPEWQRALVKVAVVAVVVIVLAIIVAAASGAAANVAAQTTTEIAKQVTIQTTRQLAIQAIMMSVLSSNAVPELIGSIMKANGANDKDSHIAEIIVMAAMMLATILAMAIAGKMSSTKPTQTANQAAENAQKAARQVENFSTRMQHFTKEVLDKVILYFKNAPREILEALKASTKREYLGLTVIKLTQTTTTGLQIAEGITKGVMLLDISQLLKAVGEYKASVDLTQELIQVLEKLLNNLQNDIDAHAQMMLTVQKDMNHIIDAANQTTSSGLRNLRA